LNSLLILAAVCLVAFPVLAQAQDQIAIIPVTELVNSNGATLRGASYDGKRLVFESNNDYTGENTDANFEIFVFDVDSRRFIQVTKTENLKDPTDATKTTLVVSNNSPSISGDGTRIVFSSNATLTTATNDDGNQEIFCIASARL
jgi:Tol biopolymer transport system component